MTDEKMSHLNDRGEARMVDVGEKSITRREATAQGEVLMPADLVSRFFDGDLPKGDAAAVARVAGIMAAKKTHELIPLCHPLPISGVEVSMEPTVHGIQVLAKVSTNSRTGVEMEALTAVSVAALTIYDMVKGLDRSVEIANIRLLKKAGGRSGIWERS